MNSFAIPNTRDGSPGGLRVPRETNGRRQNPKWFWLLSGCGWKLSFDGRKDLIREVLRIGRDAMEEWFATNAEAGWLADPYRLSAARRGYVPTVFVGAIQQ